MDYPDLNPDYGDRPVAPIPSWHADLEGKINRIAGDWEAASMGQKASAAREAHAKFILADAQIGAAILELRENHAGNVNHRPDFAANAKTTADALEHMRLAEAFRFEDLLRTAAYHNTDGIRFDEAQRADIQTATDAARSSWQESSQKFVDHDGFKPSHQVVEVPAYYDAPLVDHVTLQDANEAMGIEPDAETDAALAVDDDVNEVNEAAPAEAAPAQQDAQPQQDTPARRRRLPEGDRQPFFVDGRDETPAVVEAAPIAEAVEHDDGAAAYLEEKQWEEDGRKAEIESRNAFDGKLKALIDDTRKTDPEAAEALQIVGRQENATRRAVDKGREVSVMELDQSDPERLMVESYHEDADRHGDDFKAHPAHDRANALLKATFDRYELSFVAEKPEVSTASRKSRMPEGGYQPFYEKEPVQEPDAGKQETFKETFDKRRDGELAELEKTNPDFVEEYRRRQSKLNARDIARLDAVNKPAAKAQANGEQQTTDKGKAAPAETGKADDKPSMAIRSDLKEIMVSRIGEYRERQEAEASKLTARDVARLDAMKKSGGHGEGEGQTQK